MDSHRTYNNGNSLSLTTYSNTYVSIKIAEITLASPDVVNANSTYAFDTSPIIYESGKDTDASIMPASKITSIGNLSSYGVDNLKIGNAVNLQSLVIGTDDATQNTYFKSLTLGNNKVLKVLNVKNCVNLAGSIDASRCNI